MNETGAFDPPSAGVLLIFDSIYYTFGEFSCRSDLENVNDRMYCNRARVDHSVCSNSDT